MTTTATQPDVWDKAAAELTKYLVDLIEGAQSMLSDAAQIPLIDDKNIVQGYFRLNSPLVEFSKPGLIKAVRDAVVALDHRDKKNGRVSPIAARPQLAGALQYFKTAYFVASPGVRRVLDRCLEKGLVDNYARTYH